MDTKGLIRATKAQVKLAIADLDDFGILGSHLNQIEVKVSKRKARTRYGFYMGQCDDTGYISINLGMCPNEQEFVATLIHELAHGICHWLHGAESDIHGPKWQKIMVKMGQAPERCR